MSQTNAQQLKTIPANDIAAQMRVVVSGVDSFDNLRGSAPVPRDNKRCQRQHQPAGVDETTFSTECDRERQTGAASDHNEGCLVYDGWPSNTFMSVIVLRYTALGPGSGILVPSHMSTSFSIVACLIGRNSAAAA